MKMTLRLTGIPDLVPMMHRSPGVHVSEIINHLCIKLGHYEESDGPPSMTRLQLGQALERAVIDRYIEHDPERYIKPEEITVDDISLNIDLADAVDYAVEEMKLTWMSSRHDIHSDKFWKYLVQLKAYCYAWQTGLGRLHVCNINGDYKWGTPGADPLYRVWEFEFRRKELQENWTMLLNHRDIVAKEKEKKKSNPKVVKKGRTASVSKRLW